MRPLTPTEQHANLMAKSILWVIIMVGLLGTPVLWFVGMRYIWRNISGLAKGSSTETLRKETGNVVRNRRLELLLLAGALVIIAYWGTSNRIEPVGPRPTWLPPPNKIDKAHLSICGVRPGTPVVVVEKVLHQKPDIHKGLMTYMARTPYQEMKHNWETHDMTGVYGVAFVDCYEKRGAISVRGGSIFYDNEFLIKSHDSIARVKDRLGEPDENDVANLTFFYKRLDLKVSYSLADNTVWGFQLGTEDPRKSPDWLKPEKEAISK